MKIEIIVLLIKIKKMESLSLILKHRGKTFSLIELGAQINNISQVEHSILHARTTGLSFCQIGDDDAKRLLDSIMLRGAAICGCSLPNTEFFADIIADEISTLLDDFGFRELTEAEVLLALRLNARVNIKFPSGVDIEHISFSGNCINTVYLSKILMSYMALRSILDRKLQNHIDGY